MGSTSCVRVTLAGGACCDPVPVTVCSWLGGTGSIGSVAERPDSVVTILDVKDMEIGIVVDGRGDTRLASIACS